MSIRQGSSQTPGSKHNISALRCSSYKLNIPFLSWSHACLQWWCSWISSNKTQVPYCYSRGPASYRASRGSEKLPCYGVSENHDFAEFKILITKAALAEHPKSQPIRPFSASLVRYLTDQKPSVPVADFEDYILNIKTIDNTTRLNPTHGAKGTRYDFNKVSGISIGYGYY